MTASNPTAVFKVNEREVVDELEGNAQFFIRHASPVTLLRLLFAGGLAADLTFDPDTHVVDADVVSTEATSRLGDNNYLNIGSLIDGDSLLQDMQTYASHWGVALPSSVLECDCNADATSAFDEWFLADAKAQDGARESLLDDVEACDFSELVSEFAERIANEQEEAAEAAEAEAEAED